MLPLELLKHSATDARKRAGSWLERMGLADRASDYPDRLSGGEQQRIAIARALVHDPDLILADEPTGNLDLETGREVLDILDGCVREAGKTLVMVTHGSEVVGLADRILTVRDGKLTDATPVP